MKIFVVDDDAVARMIVMDQLGALEHEVCEFGGAAALLAAMDEAPDLILLDIEMPGMDGIAACRALRQDGHEKAQVIFVSSHDDQNIRLAAYEAGGSDFIVKPYFARELSEKVRVAEQWQARHREVAQQAQFAQSTAFTAMSSLGEMGVVLQFLRDSFAAADAGQLARHLLDALRQYGLNGLLALRLASGRQYFSGRGECTPLEVSIIEHAAGMDRIFQFRDRMAINYPDVTLIVLDLPHDDQERAGRLRDHLAILAEGADARLKALESERQRIAQAAGIVQAVNEFTQTLAEIEASQAKVRLRASEIDAAYLEDLVKTFVHLGLTEGQEAALAEMAERTHAALNVLHEDDYLLGKRLRAVTDRLRQLTS